MRSEEAQRSKFKALKHLLTFLSLLSLVSTHAAEKPNIILIFADDLGWKDVGYQGRGFYEMPGRPASVIRKGDWKLHLYHEEWQLDGGREKLAANHAGALYNVAEDIGERNDVASANPAKRDELLGELFAWFKSTDALVPTKPNPQYDPAAKGKPGQKDKNK